MNRNLFHSHIKELNDEIDIMGSKVLTIFKETIESVVFNLSSEVCDSLIMKDDLIDKLEVEIQEKAIKLVALQQPMARDLRRIFTVTKVVTDLERICDLCVDILKLKKRITCGHSKNITSRIMELSSITEEMMEGALDSYLEENISLAKEVSLKDDLIDKVYIELLTELRESASSNPENVGYYTHMMFINKFVERIGDHLTNICEWTHYSKTGKIIDFN